MNKKMHSVFKGLSIHGGKRHVGKPLPYTDRLSDKRLCRMVQKAVKRMTVNALGIA